MRTEAICEPFPCLETGRGLQLIKEKNMEWKYISVAVGPFYGGDKIFYPISYPKFKLRFSHFYLEKKVKTFRAARQARCYARQPQSRGPQWLNDVAVT